jgi:hypothetical protein
MSEIAAGTLERLATTPSVLRALVNGMPDALLEQPLDDGWSVRDVLAHLASVEPVTFRGRIATMLASPGADIANVDETELLEASGLRALPGGELLDRFEADRRDSLALVAALSPEELDVGGTHSEVGRIDVANIVNHIAYHDAAHLQQVARILALPADAARGALRRYT